MPHIPSLLDLLKAGVHFGHRKSKWHPKMEPYIYTVREGVHIFDLDKTVEALKRALDFTKNISSQGGQILFLGTKKQAMPIIKAQAERAEMPYITDKWIGGTFTNFSVISKLIKKMKDLEIKKGSGDLDKYSKKEQINFDKEIQQLNKKIGGLRNLNKLPQAIFIIDLSKEKNACQEARKKHIPIVAICDTNVNPTDIDYPIPANDDAVKSLETIIGLMADAVLEGRKEQVVKE
ncbi:MAG: 30S ribosomal protein S2 [Patescibacteria group bacterium]|jgi:small subunit ribosomal protein S2|nr:30S ribosomal protein S2 [Patescibacteria group bacterium]